ncbi:MAG: acetyl-CoA carboxylase biotin carboxylase subunit [Pseudomonadota bacterium]|jgi:acetyl-CoA carboxylase biotin carboxylase subunit|nr:acetyl-CoA carboxylase biotin carboxylase subunit [Pseudomonadota bacterium]|tara:strand:- start:2823 stop:4163 length:1341 start_codon:yes stop_codon:yes gene_type:complete
MFKKIVIANRGDVAIRVQRACHEMGIKTVAVHSTADSSAMNVRLADESVCIGPPKSKDSYLNIPAILSAASISGADAIHPGVGFLSENPAFAQIVSDHGLTFIGPKPEHIKVMGDKIEAKKMALELGIPCVPGSDGAIRTTDEALLVAKDIGFPIIVKAAAGGGGKGMQIAFSETELSNAIKLAQSEAEASFGSGEVYIERYLSNPRHIEIQIIGDKFGNVVHLGERDCSLQRRHQKILEETPSPALTKKVRNDIGALAATAMKKFGYESLGTIEFLYENGEFYFIEMNTRLQVEHPITEMVTGIDLVQKQIQISAGEPLGISQDEVSLKGHSIECRINAEDPENFIPSPGKIVDYHPPGGFGIRIDSGIYAGYEIPPHYDSLIAKLIVHGQNREQCLSRLHRALDEFVIGNIKTTIALHQKLLSTKNFIDGEYDIHWLEKHLLKQ